MDTPQAQDPATGPDRVVVGSDGSWHSRAALDAAAEEALRRGVPLEIVTLCGGRPDPDLTWAAQVTQQREQLAEGRRSVEAAAVSLRRTHAGLEVSTDAVAGDDPAGLKRALVACVLLVLGSFGRQGRRSFTLGSSSREFLHAARCPVLVVPEDGAPARPADLPADVLVGLDERPTGVDVLREAGDQARRRQRHLTVLHSYHPMPGEAADEALARARRWCEKQLMAAGLTATDGITHVVTPDPATDALLRHAMAAELVVIGSRGPMALAGLSLGSVSRAVLDAARRPVLVVLPSVAGRHHGDRAPGVLEHGAADRAEDGATEPSTSVGSHHEELGAVRGGDQR